MISAVIVCFNEARKLNNCLKSVEDFAGEVIVVDLGSSDDSIKIAEKYKAKVYPHKFVSLVEEVRNFATSKASGDWILVLDPDEEVSEQLKNRLKELSKQEEYVAISIPRKNIFFGKWIKYTNWWPDYHVRFFKKGFVEWINRIHLYPKVHGQHIKLPSDEELAIVHFGYESIRQFINRQNRYSTVEAMQKYSTGEKFSYLNFYWWPIREFLVRYIRHTGFLDGFYGLILTVLMMVYRLMVAVKLWELEHR